MQKESTVIRIPNLSAYFSKSTSGSVTHYWLNDIDYREFEVITEISEDFYLAAKKEFGPHTYYEDAKMAIKRLDSGPFYHNIVTMILGELAKKVGPSASNKLIDELSLDFEKVV